MKAVLFLYLTRKLEFDADFATILYHIFIFLIFFAGLPGAIIADSFIVKFKTISGLSIVYVTGSCLIAAGAVEVWGLPAVVLTSVGLFLVAVGSGGIKPCVTSFGANQFKLPEQARSLTRYFSIFYFVSNLDSLASSLSPSW